MCFSTTTRRPWRSPSSSPGSSRSRGTTAAPLPSAILFFFRQRPPRKHRAAFAVSEPTFPDLPRGGHGPEGIDMFESYHTKGGIRIQREINERTYRPADTALADALDNKRGVLFSSSFEFPGRYTRWDMGFVD